MDKRRHHIIQFVCLMAVFVAVTLQSFTSVVKMKPLKGVVAKEKIVVLKWETYLDGSYQDYLTEHAKRNTGFREFFIRNYNQLSYSCFHKVTNNNVFLGQNGEFFSKMYLDDVSGWRIKEFYGSVDSAKAIVHENMSATQRLMDTLEQHNTKFLFVVAPSKATIYPEYLPKAYQDSMARVTYSLESDYIEQFEQNDIPYIDFTNYFKSLKDTFPYPLYTQLGTHWANATMPLVADTILRKIESIMDCELPAIKVIDSNITIDITDADGELEDQLNLFFPLPEKAYSTPIFSLADTAKKDHPVILVVGDSYFVQLQSTCFVEAFKRWDYWRYNEEIFSSREWLNWQDVRYYRGSYRILEDADIVLVFSTAPSHYEYMYDFQHTALQLLEKGEPTDEEALQMIILRITRTPEWLGIIEKDAKEKGIPLEEHIRQNALYVLQVQQQNENL